jgi:hypothetical protein
VRDDALQFVAIEFHDATARDPDHRIFLPVTGREGIDRRIVDQEHLRHRHARRDRHFLDDIEHPALLLVARLYVEQAAAEAFRHGLAAAAQLHHAEQDPEQYDADDDGADGAENFGSALQLLD